MDAEALREALREVRELELERLGHVIDRVFAGRPFDLREARSRTSRAGRGLEFVGFRPYAQGDDPRDLDWRASARSPVLQVRQRRSEASSVWVVCLDRSASMASGAGSKWRLAAQLAAAFAYLLLRREHQVALLAFSAGVDLLDPPGRGRARYARLLARLSETLPRAEGSGTRLERCAPQLPRGASVLVLSDFLAPDALCPALDRLRARGGTLQAVGIRSPDDVASPRAARAAPVVLRDVESGARLVARLAPQSAGAAARRREALHRVLGDHCRASGIRLSLCDTSTPWRDAVVAHLLGHA